MASSRAAHFRRGLVQICDPAAASLSADLAASESWAWVDELVLASPTLDDLHRLCGSEAMSGLNGLSLSDAELGPEGALLLAASPHLNRLTAPQPLGQRH